MTYLYAVYLTFCILGYHCTADNYRIDDFSTLQQAQGEIKDIGEKPHWEIVENDPVFMYSYGECHKKRKENYKDLMMWLSVVHGADCEDCVDRLSDKRPTNRKHNLSAIS